MNFYECAVYRKGMTVAPLFIDSGAFSAYKKSSEIPLDEWISFCLEVKQKLPGVVYANMDIISKGEKAEQSYLNWLEMRKCGLDPVPVFHLGSDKKWLRKYIEQTSYVAVGAMVGMTITQRIASLDELWNEDNLLLDKHKMPKVKVHGMGFTVFRAMARYPWFSLDSTAALQHGIYGKVFVPRQKNGSWDYHRPPYLLGVSSLSPLLFKAGEHVTSLSPLHRQLLDAYIKETGFVLGSSVVHGKELKVVQEGLSNSTSQRICSNSLFLARFVKTLQWPRPFLVKPLGSLGLV
jgi:hypothetical protein